MPGKSEHLKKAQHDEQFATSLDLHSTPYLDWLVTGMFYSALHYIEAYFATLKMHSPDHRIRDSAIRRDRKISAVYNDYSELKNFSINARYYFHPFTPADVTQNLKRHLDHLKAHILSLIQ